MMITMLRNIFFSKRKIKLEQIESLSILRELDNFLSNHHGLIKDSSSTTDLLEYKKYNSEAKQPNALQYIEHLFSAVNKVLLTSNADKKFLDDWRGSLHELLVKVPYSGEHLEISHQIKHDLLNNKKLGDCSEKTKKLLLDYTADNYQDQQDTCAFLKDISTKLNEVYGEVDETKQHFSQVRANKKHLSTSFEQGMQDIKTSIDTAENIHTLKSSLSLLVDSLHSKISRGFAQDENDSRILQERVVALSAKVESLENHTKDLENRIRQKHEEAITDPLTGLLNRAGYIQKLETAWLAWQQDQVPAALLVWDIDHFKSLNDQYGHAAGDKVLQSVSKKLRASLRGDDIVARFGGEEFVMLLKNKGIKEGKMMAEKIRAIIADTEFTYKNQPLHVTISCGVAVFVQDDTPTTLFERADKALYKAKRTGRNKVEALTRKVA